MSIADAQAALASPPVDLTYDGISNAVGATIASPTSSYGTIQGNGDGGLLTVGAETRFGGSGQSASYNGTGTLPANGTQLRVTSVPAVTGQTRTITFSATGVKSGPYENVVKLTSDVFQGTIVATFLGLVSSVVKK